MEVCKPFSIIFYEFELHSLNMSLLLYFGFIVSAFVVLGHLFFKHNCAFTIFNFFYYLFIGFYHFMIRFGKLIKLLINGNLIPFLNLFAFIWWFLFWFFQSLYCELSNWIVHHIVLFCFIFNIDLSFIYC